MTAHAIKIDDGLRFRKNCKKVLIETELTLVEVGERTGHDHTYWSKRLNGRTPIRLTDVLEFAEACGVHPAELLGGMAPLGWTPPQPPHGSSDPTDGAPGPVRTGDLSRVKRTL